MTIALPSQIKERISRLKVLEMASVLAGPLCGTFFAELGAEVYKIENPISAGDVTRGWRESNEDAANSISAYYAAANSASKKIIFLNAGLANDRLQLDKLIQTADVLIVNFKAGDAEKLKLDYRAVQAKNPGLIYASISGFPKGDSRPAFDVVLQAESGMMSMNGTEESGPVKMPVAFIDILAAHQLKEAILLALLNRELGGGGAQVSVSLYDTAISSLANQASNYLMNGNIPLRKGSKHPNIAPYGDLFTTADGRFFVTAAGTEKQFIGLCKILQLPKRSEFANNKLRVINRVELIAFLSTAIAQWDSASLLKKCKDENVPAAIIKDLAEVFNEEAAKKMVLSESQEGRRTKKVKSISFHFNNSEHDS